MKIGEMNDHCGDCDLIDYCGEPYQKPYLCKDNRFNGMKVEEYIGLAETSTKGSKEDIATDAYDRRKRSV